MNTFRCSISLLLLFVGCGVLCGQTAQGKKKGASPQAIPDTMFVRYDHTPIYDSASYTASIIGDMRQWDTVIVIEKIGKFARFQFQSGFGFIARVNIYLPPNKQPKPPIKLKEETEATDTAAPATPHNPPPRPPTNTADQQPAKHQCKGLTKSRKQCSRIAEEGSEYCWQHRPTDGATDETNKKKTPRKKR